MFGFGWARATRRARRRAGAVCGLLAVLVVTLPVGPASAAVQPAVGLNGTVLGFSGWYGSYSLAGIGTGFCLDFGKAAPDSAFNYRVGSTITGTVGAQLAYVARTYGPTRDAVTAAAVKLVVHDLQNARYPYGELNVMTLQTSQMAGFSGRAGDVLTRARAVMRDAQTNYLIAPYRLTLSTPTTVAENLTVPVSLRLLDGRGKAISGARVTLTATNTTVASRTVTTDGTGQARTSFTATGGDVSVRITASVVLPSPTPVVYAPTHPSWVSRAQRVIFAGNTALTQTRVTTVKTVQEEPDTIATISVRKTGDATAYHPVDGAQFELRAGTPDGPRVAGPVTIANGQAAFGPVVTNDVGDLWLVETAAPEGYAVADPVAVPTEGAATVGVENTALRGTLRLVKLDAHTNEPVAGAVLHLGYDSDADGSYETDLGTFRSETEPVEAAELLPGRYEVTEVTAPPGYELPDDARSEVVLEPDGVLTVTFTDSSLTGVRFAKRPVGVFDPDRYSLAGAVFVVTAGPILGELPPGTARAAVAAPGEEVGRCTTDAAGRCALPDDALVTGRTYCWTETVAPRGFAKAEGDCFTATRLAEVTVVGVDEEGTYTTIELVKRDADDPDRTLPDAMYALYTDGGSEPIATATTGDDGVLRFSPVLPGERYCVREVTPPPGYQLDPALHCTEGPVAEAATIRLTMTDRVAPPPPVEPPPPELKNESPTVPMLPETGATSVQVAQMGLASLLGGTGLLLFGAPTRPRRPLWPASHGD